MSILSNLASAIDHEFAQVLPVVNALVSDMTLNYAAWQANPVVKSTEAVTALVSPVAAIDAQAVIGAASLVQALWQVFGQSPAPTPAPAIPNVQFAAAVTPASLPQPVNPVDSGNNGLTEQSHM